MTRIVLAIAALILLVAPAGADETAKPRVLQYQNTGYLYGRFDLSTTPNSCGLGVQLVLQRLSQMAPQEYTIAFARKDGVMVIPVKPGSYTIDSVAYLTESGSEYSRKPLDQLKKTFTVENRKAYYLGDFTATTKCAYGDDGIKSSWAAGNREDNFDETTKDFSKRYAEYDKFEKLAVFGE